MPPQLTPKKNIRDLVIRFLVDAEKETSQNPLTLNLGALTACRYPLSRIGGSQNLQSVINLASPIFFNEPETNPQALIDFVKTNGRTILNEISDHTVREAFQYFYKALSEKEEPDLQVKAYSNFKEAVINLYQMELPYQLFTNPTQREFHTDIKPIIQAFMNVLRDQPISQEKRFLALLNIFNEKLLQLKSTRKKLRTLIEASKKEVRELEKQKDSPELTAARERLEALMQQDCQANLILEARVQNLLGKLNKIIEAKAVTPERISTHTENSTPAAPVAVQSPKQANTRSRFFCCFCGGSEKEERSLLLTTPKASASNLRT